MYSPQSPYFDLLATVYLSGSDTKDQDGQLRRAGVGKQVHFDLSMGFPKPRRAANNVFDAGVERALNFVQDAGVSERVSLAAERMRGLRPSHCEVVAGKHGFFLADLETASFLVTGDTINAHIHALEVDLVDRMPDLISCAATLLSIMGMLTCLRPSHLSISCASAFIPKSKFSTVESELRQDGGMVERLRIERYSAQIGDYKASDFRLEPVA